uniref:Uncharacterized protein n=1 Tax=Panagrolaimus sp. JU765 TaxID=591449 RepID=A0AC34QBW9_9BILA
MKGSDTSIQHQNQCAKKENDSYQPPDDFYKVFAVKNLDEKHLSKSMEESIHFNVNPVTTTVNAKGLNNSTLEEKRRPHTATAGTTSMTKFNFPSTTDASSLIFSPPNTVPFRQRLITQPDPSTYVAPMKAAGDGTTQEGVQVKLNQLHECISKGLISEAGLKKLNYIVDEIDRELYDEAWGDFEQFVAKFPAEAAGWSQGLRILLIELRRNAHKQFPHRSGSAEIRKTK